VSLAREVGFPVAVKLASTGVTHKTELDAVKLEIEDEDGVREAYRNIRETLEEEDLADEMEGVLVQPHLCCAAEVFMGMSRDPVFGPVLAFGLGGVHVEILQDVAFGVVPLCRRDAREMIRTIRGYRLLEGYRGHPPGDVEALQEALLRLSALCEEVDELEGLDLNPVFAREPGEGCRTVDARIRVREV
jgi:acyl-CoA synthetase (NDP forming)